MLTEYQLEQAITKLSKLYNYYEGKTAIKILASLCEQDKLKVLSNSNVIRTITYIDDPDVLKTIFKYAPSPIQEAFYNNEKIQEILLSPRKNMHIKKIIKNYNRVSFLLTDEDGKKIFDFLRSIKSPNIFKSLESNESFLMLIPLLPDKYNTTDFFKSLNIREMFKNSISNPNIYIRCRIHAILYLYNMVCPDFLLTNDFEKQFEDELEGGPEKFIHQKLWRFRNADKIGLDEEAINAIGEDRITELLQAPNIDIEPIKNYLKNKYSSLLEELTTENKPSMFKKLFPKLEQDNYICFDEKDYILIKIILDMPSVNESFVKYLQGIICDETEFTKEENEMIFQSLKRRLQEDTTTYEQYEALIRMHSNLKTIFFLKFDKIKIRLDYLSGISPKQILYLNVKHINQILNNLDLLYEDELSAVYGTAIKLYLAYGLERTLKILDEEYGNLSRTFFDNVIKLDVSNVPLEKEGNKYLPSINEEFIKFMFAKKDDNHFIDMLKSNDLLNKYWYYLYNNFADIKEKCHNEITLKKVNIILNEQSPTRDIKKVTPDNYRLEENDILNNVCLGNKTKSSNEEIYKKLLDIYEIMKKRTTSSIPYVKGTVANGYTYEMMKLDDPIGFTLGYLGNCCFRIDDIGNNHLEHALKCPNGRILVIYNKSGEMAAFIPLKRNGEVLIANSIECAHKVKNEEVLPAFKEAIKEIVTISNIEPSDNIGINLVCIGKTAYLKPETIPFPQDIPTPTIYEKNDLIYGDTDCYHRVLDIVYESPDINLRKLKYGNPPCVYLDARNPIKSVDFHTSSQEEKDNALKVINSIRYINMDILDQYKYRSINEYYMSKCIYNNDWYIVITNNNQIYCDYISKDQRALKEYKVTLEQFKDQLNISQETEEIFTKKLK